MRRTISASLVALAGSVLLLSSTSGAAAVSRSTPASLVESISGAKAARDRTQSVAGETSGGSTLPLGCFVATAAQESGSQEFSAPSRSLPAIPPPTSEASGSVLVSPKVVGEEDNGDTVNLQVGQSFVLELPSVQWCVTITDPAVLAQENVSAASGIQGTFKAMAVGSSELIAVGHFPPCEPSPRVCFLPTIPVLRITVVVSDPGVSPNASMGPLAMVQGNIIQVTGSTVVIDTPPNVVHCPSNQFCPTPIVASRPISVDLTRATFFTDAGQTTERPILTDGELLTATGAFTNSVVGTFEAEDAIAGSAEG